MPVLSRILWACLVLVVVPWVGLAAGQSPSQAGPEQMPLYTLHVHEDLVQVPVLVLDQNRRIKAGLEAADFSIQLDSGPAFHPRKIHVEGDDPLSVIFLIDAGSPQQREFLGTFRDHLADLPPDLFRAGDRLSVFAFDCKLVAVAQDRPASDGLLQQKLAQAIVSPALHVPGCPNPVSLWDGVSGAASLSEGMTGRRVMVLLSPGEDRHSLHTAAVARSYTASLGITVMGIRDVDRSIDKPEDFFALLCGGTGGIDVYVTAYSLARNVGSLFSFMRHRYVVEFPLPSNGTSGLHHLDVTLADRTLIVRAAGDSAPLLDSSMFSDPELTPDAAPRPVLGTRKPMYPK